MTISIIKNRTDGRDWACLSWAKLSAFVVALIFVLCMEAITPIHAQTSVVQHSQNGAASSDGIDMAQSLERLTDAASDMIPAFVQTVEAPLGLYFETIAYYLAWLIMIMYFLKLLRETNGDDPANLFWYFGRVAVCFALLAYCGDTNGDGIRGDLINRLGLIGNSIAYGNPSTDDGASFLGRTLHTQQIAFGNNYGNFVDNKFFVKVPDGKQLVRYPDDSQSGFQLLVPNFSSGQDVQQEIANNFNPSGWNMANLFQWLNLSRGILEFGDLFLLILQGFLVACIRLAAPFMIAVAIDRDYAKRISINFAWGVVIVTIIMPIISQIIRFFAYAAANLAMDARSSQPYFQYDPTTAKIIAMGSPEYMIIICALLMTICGLCMFASPYISYKIATGSIFEAVSGAVSGWMGAIIGTGISTVSSAAGAAINKQAEQTQADGAQAAGGVSAASTQNAANIGVAANASAEISRSRSQANAEVGGYGIQTGVANAKAGATQSRLEAENATTVGASDIEQNAKLGSAAVTAQGKLDDSIVDNAGITAPVIGAIDNVSRATGIGTGAVGAGWGRNTNGATAPPMHANTPAGQYGAARPDHVHGGIDVQGFKDGDTVGAAASGRVVFAGNTKGSGNTVIIDHGNGSGTAYRHLQNGSIDSLRAGQSVQQGQMIGKVGNTGTTSKGAHLHFEAGKLGASGRGGQPRIAGDPNQTNLRPINLSTATVGGGRTGAYVPPQGVQDLLAQTGGNSRGFTRAKRDAYVGVENAARDAQGTGDAARYRASGNVEAARTFTGAEVSINNQEFGLRTGVARRADSERQQITARQSQEQFKANQVTYEGQMGNPNAAAGTPERLGAVGIQHEAASQAARLHALSSIVTSVGSTVASQAQGALTTFNRY